MGDIGSDAHGCVVTAVLAALALPPSRAQDVIVPDQPMTELEKSRSHCGRQHAIDQALQYRQAGTGLHYADESDYCLPAHDAIGVKNDHHLVVLAPSLTEVM